MFKDFLSNSIFFFLQAQLSILLGPLLLTFCLETAEGFYTPAPPGVRNGNYSMAAVFKNIRDRGQHDIDQQHARLSRDLEFDNEEYGRGFLPPSGRYKVEEDDGGAYSTRTLDYIADSYSAVELGIGIGSKCHQCQMVKLIGIDSIAAEQN